MNQIPENVNLLYSRLILAQIQRLGIYNFILSPGLRNAPLMIALKGIQKEYQNVEVSIALDERAAGYMALGQYKACGLPSVLICTSGTAMANYYPAILESQKTNSPVIIISADRPQELHFESSNQTMDQLNLFKSLKDKTLNLPIQDTGMSLQSCFTQVERYIQSALNGEVVHLNFPFREPLDVTPEKISEHLLEEYQLLIKQRPTNLMKSSESQISFDASMFTNKNGLLVIGELNSALSLQEREVLSLFIRKCPWPKVIDISTSLKYNYSLAENSFPSFDHPEVYQAFEELNPDIILHLGGKLTSKKYHQFIYQNQIPIIKVSNDKNTERALSRVNQYFAIEPHEFANSFLKQEMSFSLREEKFIEKIQQKIIPIIHKKIEIIEQAEFTFPKISKCIVEQLQEKSDLYIGNSTAIRSFDSYSSLNQKKSLSIHSHRGVSGIEGFLAASSSFHKSKPNKTPTVLVLGDISFLHDLNSLNLIKDSSTPFIIVLINNFGGGIFSLVPFKDQYDVMPWMTTPHEYQFDKICETFSIKHQFIYNYKDFKKEFIKAQKTNITQLLELNVDNSKNFDIYQKLKTVRL
jgi:2-succinyl-5-enolpyruvyl-6-hydroxy-3-cyclohexene-1-carboxylate synthase